LDCGILKVDLLVKSLSSCHCDLPAIASRSGEAGGAQRSNLYQSKSLKSWDCFVTSFLAMTGDRTFYETIKVGQMKKFSREQMIFALLVGAIILGITIYRYFFMF
jgi:hypothetical protein